MLPTSNTCVFVNKLARDTMHKLNECNIILVSGCFVSVIFSVQRNDNKLFLLLRIVVSVLMANHVIGKPSNNHILNTLQGFTIILIVRMRKEVITTICFHIIYSESLIN